MSLILADATIEVTNDGSGVVNSGPIYKTERDITLNVELDSTNVEPMSNTFAQQDVFFATISKKATLSFTTVIGKLTETTTVAGSLVDMLSISNLSVAEGTAVGGKKVFDFTPNSTGEGKGEITLKNVDRTIVLEKCSSSMSISGQRGGEFELKFELTGYVQSITDGQTNTLADPVKPASTVLTTTDGINTGVTVDGNIVDPQSVDFAMNLEVEMPPVMVAANQLVRIKNAKHTLKIGAYLSANFQEGFDSIVAGTTVPIVVNMEDSTDTVIWELSAPVAKVTNTPNRNDSSGVYAIEKEYLCRPTAGNDNFTLKYYSDIASS